MPGTDTLAYFDSVRVTKKKVFITLKPEVDVIKLFYFVNDEEIK